MKTTTKNKPSVKAAATNDAQANALTTDTGIAGGDEQSRCECGGGWNEDGACELCGAKMPTTDTTKEEADETPEAQAAEDFAAREEVEAKEKSPADAVKAGAPFGNKNAAGSRGGHRPEDRTALSEHADSLSKTALSGTSKEAHDAADEAHTNAAFVYRDVFNKTGHGSAKAVAEHHEKAAMLHRLHATKASAAPTANFVRCRDTGVPLMRAKRTLELGKPFRSQWMPGNVSTITASYGRGDENVPIELTVKCDEAGADRVARSFAEIRANNPRRPPFICVEHQAKERAGEPTGFEWSNDPEPGIYMTFEPSALGVHNVNGGIHHSFSPTFDTDADYSKLQCSDCSKARGKCACNGSHVFTFAAGVRGSRENPAEVTRLDAQSVGSLTNWNAFKEIRPISARQPDGTVKGGAPMGNQNAAGPHQNAELASHHLNERSKFSKIYNNSDLRTGEPQESQDAAAASRDAHQASAQAYTTGERSDHREASEAHFKAATKQDKYFNHGEAAVHRLKASIHSAHARGETSKASDANPLLAPIFAATLTASSVADELAAQLKSEQEGESVEALIVRAQEREELIGGIELLPKTRGQVLAETMEAVLANGVVHAGAPFGKSKASCRARMTNHPTLCPTLGATGQTAPANRERGNNQPK